MGSIVLYPPTWVGSTCLGTRGLGSLVAGEMASGGKLAE